MKEVELLNMSFFHGTLDKEKAIKVMENTNKKLLYRYGFSYRGAEARLVTRERALEIIRTESQLDIKEDDTEIVLNAYSENDMW